ncbi:hypothetical protein SAMN04488058_10597 [Deinococcus reticulitermitis]|uniref:Uncharacterized protein n=1 Tax=Deinococcus reticulitermitis TaxID=856736 RepID=A0A1H6XIU5_9DEIO|nr:hypothetical protein [Deinococcus reticulitermitis]SEJ24505.1 hypothetical protein SAMN04488058_10597 [Deinococcus reticulitermitis]
MSDSRHGQPPGSQPPSDHSVQDLLRELFPETHRELFGERHPGRPPTLGLYPVADGRLALVHGDQLAEFTPVSPRGASALHCDLCHHTRSRSEAQLYRVRVGERRTRYLTLCAPTAPCQGRAGPRALASLADRIFPIEPVYND